MGAWLGGRPGGPRGPVWSRPAATVFWGARVLRCVGGVSSLAANSGVWGRSWEHPWSGFEFSVRRRSDGKVADSTARETGGKQQQAELPSASFYKTDAHGSNGVRAGPRGPASGGFVTCVPQPLASTPFGEKEDQALGADRARAAQVHPQSSDGPTLRSGLSLSHPSGGRPRPEPTRGQSVCPVSEALVLLHVCDAFG